MNVTLQYSDSSSFTIDEIKAQAERNYGSGVSVKVMPESTRPADLVEFAIGIWITGDQVSYYYDDPHTYKDKMKTLKAELMYRYGEAIDSVIKDNERKLTGD